MRAVAIESFGGPEQLKPVDLPRPRPAPGELLVRVVAAGVSPLDCALRRGELADGIPPRFPLVPGRDVAGVVEAFGEGAAGFRRGDRVWAFVAKPIVQWGCYAEYVAVPERQAAPMPARLLFEEAASVPLAALAACQALETAGGIGAGTTVLVHAAAGGVGQFAVQLARLAGARVIGTAGSANQPFVLALGADAGIDYTREDFREAMRRLCPDGADVVLDLVGGETLARSLAVLARGGRLISMVETPDRDAAAEHGVHAHGVHAAPNAEQLRRLARLFDEKKLRTHVHKIYPLAHAEQAQRAIETRHGRGKLVLNL